MQRTLLSNRQGRNKGGKGDAIPRGRVTMGRQVTAGGAEWLRGSQKVPTMSQVHSSIQYICLRKTSVSNMGAPNLLLAPGAIQARNQGVAGGLRPPRKFFAPSGKICWAYFKTIEHSLKNLSPSQKTLRPPYCPKLVTGLSPSNLVTPLVTGSVDGIMAFFPEFNWWISMAL